MLHMTNQGIRESGKRGSGEMHGITATPEKYEKTACDKYEVSLFQSNQPDCVND